MPAKRRLSGHATEPPAKKAKLDLDVRKEQHKVAKLKEDRQKALDKLRTGYDFKGYEQKLKELDEQHKAQIEEAKRQYKIAEFEEKRREIQSDSGARIKEIEQRLWNDPDHPRCGRCEQEIEDHQKDMYCQSCDNSFCTCCETMMTCEDCGEEFCRDCQKDGWRRSSHRSCDSECEQSFCSECHERVDHDQ